MAESSRAGPSQSAGQALSTSAPQWRQFTFFDVEQVKDAEDPSQSPAFIREAKPPLVITQTAPTSPVPASIIVSVAQHVTILDRDFSPTKRFRAWDNNGKATALVEAGGLLVGIGEDDTSRYPVLKIWDLTRDDKKKGGHGGPVLMRNVRIQHGQRPHPVSSIALTTNLSHLAVGLGDGTVLLYRHLLQSLTTSPTSLTSLPKARVIHEPNSVEPITGLGFREASAASNRANKALNTEKTGSSSISLFIVTINRVLSAVVSGRGSEARTIDDKGSGLGCATMDWNRQAMVVARDDGIFLYGPEDRGECYAYEGPKSSISIFHDNLIILSPPFFASAGSNSATVRNYVKNEPNGTSSDVAKVTIFDLQNKLIAYSGTFREGVRHVFHQWGEIFVLGSESKLSRLDEHSVMAKLEVLYRRNLFTLAISLAKSSEMGDAAVADIHRRYGDYLYTKGDFDGSIDQFVRTLGFLQPSYVIRKFLDAQRIENLTTYLQELHSRNLATPDHTTLLLNCFTKTGDRTQLDAFIKAEVGRSGSGDIDELPFDLDTAIRVCRHAGFFEHATYLAKKWGRHEDYLRIQIEDAQQYGDALRYLRSLGPEACEENMVLYGRMLLQHEPVATTDLLIDLCSGQLGKRPATTTTVDVKESGGNSAGAPAVLSYLGVNRVAGMLKGETQSPTTPSAVHAGLQNGDTPVEKVSLPNEGKDEAPSYIPPSPRRYFAHFVDHRSQFVRFLESVASILWNQKLSGHIPKPRGVTASRLAELPQTEDASILDQRAVWNTLLELYLFSVDVDEVEAAEEARNKALDLLMDKDKPYDPVHAMILCSTAGFTDGLVGLWEAMGMYEDVLRFWMDRSREASDEQNESKAGDREPSDEVLRCLDLYGPANLHLYPLVLRYLTSSSAILGRQSSHIPQILATIDEHRILPPLAVIQLLSRNGVASVGTVKSWLKTKVEETRQDVESDKQLVKSYRNETLEKEKELKGLADTNSPEVFQVTRCAACQAQLDLPSVHFMCKHSYHQRCLSDSEPECTLCARQHSIIREVRRGQTRLADRHDLFLDEVRDADDGFAVVSGAFGRGLMSKPVEG